MPLYYLRRLTGSKRTESANRHLARYLAFVAGAANVGGLHLVWSTVVADDGQQEASPLIWNGVMYIATPHDGVKVLEVK